MKLLDQPAVLEEVIYRLSNVRPDSPRQWGKMTPHQMLCHLSDSYDTAMGLKKVGSASGLFQRTVMKYVALKTPLRWPQGVKTRPELDQSLGQGTRPADFMADRERVVQSIERFTARKDFTLGEHPIFGPMTDEDWMRWGYLHPDHHLRQFGC